MRHDSSMAIEGNLSVHREIWNARTSEKRAVYVTIIMFQSGKGVLLVSYSGIQDSRLNHYRTFHDETDNAADGVFFSLSSGS